MKRIMSMLLAATTLVPLSLATSAHASSSVPSCIVSLSPTATETLFAIGAGPQVQAVDRDSNYPTKGLPKLRIDALNPSVEAVAGICHVTKTHSATPDLVIISYNANQILEKLTALHVHVVEQDAATSLADVSRQIKALGALTGHVSSSTSLATSLTKQVAALVASIPRHVGKVVTVYYELDPTLYSLTSETFVGSIIKALGMVNVADADSTSGDFGYPQLGVEYLAASSPKIIFLADTKCCSANYTMVAHRNGFSRISAVVHHHVVGLDDDIASRWGPRLGVLVGQLTAALKATLNDGTVWKK
ncbi:MAG: ABC transporter substrate-binding protein [Actinomycetota bacterium]|jgi:iron complex transport system substrate-binding protein